MLYYFSSFFHQSRDQAKSLIYFGLLAIRGSGFGARTQRNSFDEFLFCFFQLAVHIFEAVMYSIQIDHSYIVIERIIAHIEKTLSIAQKSNMAQVGIVKLLIVYIWGLNTEHIGIPNILKFRFPVVQYFSFL